MHNDECHIFFFSQSYKTLSEQEIPFPWVAQKEQRTQNDKQGIVKINIAGALIVTTATYKNFGGGCWNSNFPVDGIEFSTFKSLRSLGFEYIGRPINLGASVCAGGFGVLLMSKLFRRAAMLGWTALFW